jgi:hypothetical protein
MVRENSVDFKYEPILRLFHFLGVKAGELKQGGYERKSETRLYANNNPTSSIVVSKGSPDDHDGCKAEI